MYIHNAIQQVARGVPFSFDFLIPRRARESSPVRENSFVDCSLGFSSNLQICASSSLLCLAVAVCAREIPLITTTKGGGGEARG